MHMKCEAGTDTVYKCKIEIQVATLGSFMSDILENGRTILQDQVAWILQYLVTVVDSHFDCHNNK